MKTGGREKKLKTKNITVPSQMEWEKTGAVSWNAGENKDGVSRPQKTCRSQKWHVQGEIQNRIFGKIDLHRLG